MAATAKTEVPRDKARSGSRKAGKSNDQAQATEAGLDLLRVLGWMVVHDVVVPGTAGRVVDHVAAGPSGVYVVNTVDLAGPLTVRDDVLLCGTANMAGELDDLAAAAEDVRAVLNGHPVAPMLCFVRGEEYTAFVGGAAVCTTENVLDVLTSQKARFDGTAQAAVARSLKAALTSADAPRLAPVAPPAPEAGASSGKHRHSVRFPRFGRGSNAEPEAKIEAKTEPKVEIKPDAKPVQKAEPKVEAPGAKAAPAEKVEKAPVAKVEAAKVVPAPAGPPKAQAPAAPPAKDPAAIEREEAAIREALELAARTEQERADLAAERDRVAAERARVDEERKQAAEARAKVEAEKKQAEQARAQVEAEKQETVQARAKVEAERKQAEQARAQVEAEKQEAAAARAKVEAERKQAEEARAQVAAERRTAAEELARVEAERKQAEQARAEAEAERKRAEEEIAEAQAGMQAELQAQLRAERERIERQHREAAEQRKQAVIDEQRSITEERKRAAEERARAAAELAAAQAEQERIAAERRRVVEERRLAEEAEARAVAERKRAAAERKAAERAAELAAERAEQERAAAARKQADREARERHLAERAAADVAAQRGEPVEEIVAQVLPQASGSAPIPARFAAPPVVARPPEPVAAEPPSGKGGLGAAMKIAAVAALVVGLVAGVGPRVGDVVAWGQGLFGATQAAAYGEQVVAEANPYHPELTFVMGKPVPTQVTAGQVAKGSRAVVVPLRVLNAGGDRWLLRAGTTIVAVDSLGVEHRLARNVQGVKGGKVLAPQVRVNGGGNAAGMAVFAVPNGRTIDEVRIELSPTDGDTLTWKAGK